MTDLMSLIQPTLLSKYSPTHLKNSFKTLSAFFGILTKCLHASFFDLIFDFLPPTTKSSYLCILSEVRLGLWHPFGWLIDDLFSDI